MEEGYPPINHHYNNNINIDGVPEKLAPPPPYSDNDNPCVVQFPRDQVFKVPPPENAEFIRRLAENDNNVNNKNKRVCCCTRCCCITLTTIIIVFIILVSVGVHLAIMFYKPKPEGPHFSVKSLIIRKHKPSKMYPPPPPPPPTFNLTLSADPVIVKGIKLHYPSTGSSNLFYEKNRIATGKFPAMDLDSKTEGPITLRMFMTAFDGPLPDDVEKSLKFDPSVNVESEKIPITMEVKMTAAVVENRYDLEKKRMRLNVKCRFRVTTLGQGSELTKQVCKPNLKS